MAVGRERVPAHRVRAGREPPHRRGHVAAAPTAQLRAWFRPEPSSTSIDGQLDELVEVEPHHLRRRRELLPGIPARRSFSVACAHAAAGTRECRSDEEEGEASHRCGGPASSREVAEDRRDVAVGEEHHRERDHDEREARPATPPSAAGSASPSRSSDAPSSVQPSRWWRNAAAREEPRVLLVDEERDARDGDADRRREPPPAAFVSFPCASAELGGAHDHQRLRPRAVRDHVDRRVGVERHHGPHEHADREGDAGPEVDAPAAGRARPPRRRAPRRAASARRGGTRVAKSQCTISALRLHRAPPGRESSGRATSEREEQPDRDHEQRRLDQEPPEALAARVQQRDPVGLGERPERRRRAPSPARAMR